MTASQLIMRLAKITTAFVAVLILVGFSALAIKSGVGANGIDFSTPKLQSTEAKLKNVNFQYEQLNSQLDKQSSSDKQKIEELKAEKLKLEQQVQAKAEEKEKLRIAAANAANTLTATAHVSAAPLLPAGSHQDWMAQAGIDPSNYGYVDYIVSHESGWNPNAVNASSGACGLGQQLPCGKWAGAWNDPIAALVAMNIYVGKFGGWAGAYNYWTVHHNY